MPDSKKYTVDLIAQPPSQQQHLHRDEPFLKHRQDLAKVEKGFFVRTTQYSCHAHSHLVTCAAQFSTSQKSFDLNPSYPHCPLRQLCKNKPFRSLLVALRALTFQRRFLWRI